MEQRLKIVRTDGVKEQKSMGNYYWDTDTNNWATSKLKDMLNGIYYESSTGDCYRSNNVSECDFNSGTDLPKGLDDTARNMIDKEVIWNIGGWTDSKITVKQFYEKERGTSVYNNIPTEWSKETDVSGKYNGIGLIYPSDFGYAVGEKVRNNCLIKNLYDYDEGDCKTNDWLKPNSHIWSISPFLSDSFSAFRIGSSGYVFNYVYSAYGAWPTVYLKSKTMITSGQGTIEEPYELQLNA